MRNFRLRVFALGLLVSGSVLMSGTESSTVVIEDGDSIAFLGDSITYLGYAHQPNGYVRLVMEGLREAGVEAVAIPAGVGGNTTRDMLARLDKDVIEKAPTWVTVNSGINDSPRMTVEEFAANLREIVDRLEAAGISVILLNTTIGSGENLTSPSSLKRLEFCGEFAKLAEEKGLLLVDLNTALSDALREMNAEGYEKLRLTYDGTHLNGLGNQIVATEILQSLGVSAEQIAILHERWADYEGAVGMPEVSLETYLGLNELAESEGVSVAAIVARILTESVEVSP